MAFASPTDAFDFDRSNSTGELVAVMKEVWAGMALEAYFPNLTALNHFTDLSRYLDKDGFMVHVPDIYTNKLTVATQSTQGAGIVDTAPASVDVTIKVDTHKYVAWVIGDMDLRQIAKDVGLMQKYVREAKELLMGAVEDSIFALYSGIHANFTTGVNNGAVTDAHLRTAIALLENISYFPDKLAWFFDTKTYWHQIAAIQKFYDKSINGADSVVRTGNFGPLSSNPNVKGSLYGIPCYVTSRVVKDTSVSKNLLAHPEWVGFAVSTPGSMVRAQVDYHLELLGTLFVSDIMYGVGEMRATGTADSPVVLIESLTTTISS